MWVKSYFFPSPRWHALVKEDTVQHGDGPSQVRHLERGEEVGGVMSGPTLVLWPHTTTLLGPPSPTTLVGPGCRQSLGASSQG